MNCDACCLPLVLVGDEDLVNESAEELLRHSIVEMRDAGMGRSVKRCGHLVFEHVEVDP